MAPKFCKQDLSIIFIAGQRDMVRVAHAHMIKLYLSKGTLKTLAWGNYKPDTHSAAKFLDCGPE